jgi:hypothetical protein
LGIAAAGVESRITMKSDVIFGRSSVWVFNLGGLQL